MIRKPAVAGHFYPSSQDELSHTVETFTDDREDKESAIGIISPHAGLIYSGAVAGAVYSSIKIPHTLILLGPNHTGMGKPVSMMMSGSWKIPTGTLDIDETLAAALKDRCHLITEDAMAHAMEHSLEVQLPFILKYSSDVQIVPVIMMTDSLDDCRVVGEALADVIKEAGYSVTIVASSDMSHYESDAVARVKDRSAIDQVIEMAPAGLFNTVRNENISMCGVVPVTTMLYASKRLGAVESRLIKYMTSGEVSGDYDYVVGYAGMIIR